MSSPLPKYFSIFGWLALHLFYLFILSRGEDSKAGVLLSLQMQEMALHHHHHQHHHQHQHPDGTHYDPARNHPLINSSPPILPNPMSALSQLNTQVSRSALPHGSPSPPGSKSATPSPSSSNQEEESDPHLKVLMWLSQGSAAVLCSGVFLRNAGRPVLLLFGWMENSDVVVLELWLRCFFICNFVGLR